MVLYEYFGRLRQDSGRIAVLYMIHIASIRIIMRSIYHFLIGLSLLALAVSLGSCDVMSSVEYNVHNMTSDTVTVTFYQEIMTSPYQGYTIIENDSVTTHHAGDSDYVAVLAPNQYLRVQREWDGLYREEQVVPAWRYISSIKIADTELAPEQWTTESLWHVRTEGGGRFSHEESRYYDLWIRIK